MQAWFNGRTSASQAEDAGSIPVACFFGGSDMAEEFEQQVLREHDDNPLRPVKSNMVENIKLETIETYEKALALNDKDTVKRIEWELSTLTIHKKELREYSAGLEKEMRKAAEDLQFERAAMLRDKVFEYRASLS